MDDLFYHLYQQFPTEVVFTKVGKNQLDLDTGIRVVLNDINLTCRAVKQARKLSPSVYAKMQGIDEKRCLEVLIEFPYLVTINTECDYFTHNGTKYTKLKVEEYGLIQLVYGESLS